MDSPARVALPRLVGNCDVGGKIDMFRVLKFTYIITKLIQTTLINTAYLFTSQKSENPRFFNLLFHSLPFRVATPLPHYTPHHRKFSLGKLLLRLL